MRIEVEYIDQNTKKHNQTYKLTRLAFAKHLAIAGQAYAPTPAKLIRTLAMFFHYNYYMKRKDFYNNKFSEPPKELYDPTEKSQFSNLAGKAIADFLSKRIDKSIHTVNYEAAMRLRGIPLNGRRPDLLAFTKKTQFAIEAKGYSKGCGNMSEHKAQSKSGGIPVNYSIACVSYHLYQRVQCNYHDPFNDNIPYDFNLLEQLTKSYYQGLSLFLDRKHFEYNEFEYKNERFYQVKLKADFFTKELFYRRLYPVDEVINCLQPSLILPIKIKEYASNGIPREFEPFIDDSETNYSIYIDNDHVGLKLETYKDYKF